MDVGLLLDEGRWTLYQRWLVFLTALSVVFDGIDNQLLGVALPSIMRDWSAARSAFAPVVSFGYLGMVAGGIVGGVAGDRVGRRTALAASMLLFGVMTLGASRAGGVMTFAILRCLAGVGLGGAIPNAAALAAEFVPARRRSLAVTITAVCTPVGAMLCGLIAIPMLPSLGWRAMFVAGGLFPMAGAVAISRLLPESPRFLTRHPHRAGELAASLRRMGLDVADGTPLGDASAAHEGRVSPAALFSRSLRTDTVALWVAFLSSLIAIYLTFNWLPTLMADAGFSIAMASAGILWFNLGGIAGAVTGAVAINRVGSRRTMLVPAALAVAGLAALARMRLDSVDARVLLATLGAVGACMNCVQCTLFALAAHVYPHGIRATGVGGAAAFGRLGAIASGYVGVWALGGGSRSFFGLMAVSLAVCVAAIASVRRHVPRWEGQA